MKSIKKDGAELPSRIRELDFDGNQISWIQGNRMKLYVESSK